MSRNSRNHPSRGADLPDRPHRTGWTHAPAAAEWRGVLAVGAVAAISSVALIAVQVVVFALNPPPENAAGVVALMQRDPMLGLMSLDVLYIVNNVLVALLYLAVTVVLFPMAPSLATIALTLGLLGVAAYLGSNPSVELLALANRAAEAAPAEQAALLSEADALLTAWRGTAFLAYYFLSAAALLLFAVAMLRTHEFSRATGVFALIAGALMLVPSTFGAVGIVFALLSLVPWCVMCLLAAGRLFALSVTRTAEVT